MLIKFTDEAQEHYEWMEKHEPKLQTKIDAFINAIIATPYCGLGKPEPLKHEYAGYWSRRINKEHRLVYRIDGDTLIILQCRYHY